MTKFRHDRQETILDGQKIPTSRRGHWIIYACLAAVGIMSVVVSQLYRQLPKRSEVIERRKVKPERSSYILVLSAGGKEFARQVAGDVAREIGGDSAKTKMVITSTAVYKQCTSLAEFRLLIGRGIQQAHPPALGTQSLMLAKILDVLGADTARARLYIVGKLGANSLESIQKEMQTTLNGIRLRSQKLGRVEVIFYPHPKPDTVSSEFAEYLRKGGFSVYEQ